LGRRADRSELHVPDDAEVEIVETDRGGKSTYHGPGQLVCYPILDLRLHGEDVKRYVRDLEEALIRTAQDFGIAAERRTRCPGVWVDGSKLAAIGVHISRSVTSHGFALNVNPDLTYFDLIIPCGITARPVTSMEKELGRELDLNAVAESISRNFGVVFQSQILWVDTIDALLGRTVGVPMTPPPELHHLHKEDENSWA
jgi:lipoyl(octanoyl) transferase